MNEYKLNPVEDILISVYEDYKQEFTLDNFIVNSELYDVNKKFTQFHTDSDIIKFKYKNHKNYKLMFKNVNVENNIPAIINQLLIDINRTIFYDKIHDKKIMINDAPNSIKMFEFYKLLNSIYPSLFQSNSSITPEDFKKVLETRDCWNPVLLNADEYAATESIVITSLFNTTIPEGVIITNEIKLVFYIGLLFIQLLDTSFTISSIVNNSNSYFTFNMKEKIIILDLINEKPYFITALSMLSHITVNNEDYLLTVGYIYYSNTLDSFDCLDTNTLIKLLYKPNLSNTSKQDCVKYMIETLKKINYIHILKYLSLDNNNQDLNYYKPFRPKDIKYEEINELDCSVNTDDNYKNCTYNGVLKYYENQIIKPMVDIDIKDIINIIKDFIGNESFKYMPLCFIISINMWNCNKLFGFSEKLKYDRQFVIEISYDTKIYIKYIDGNKEIIELLPKFTLEIRIPKYQKLFFIVSKEIFDKTNLFINKETEYEYGDPSLPIPEIEKIISNNKEYRQAIDSDLEYIPLFVSPNLVKNILGILLPSYFYFNTNFCINYLIFTNIYHNYIENIDLLLRNTFLRIISDIQMQVNKPDFYKYKDYLANIKKDVNKSNEISELIKSNFYFVYTMISLMEDYNTKVIFKNLLSNYPKNKIITDLQIELEKLLNSERKQAPERQSRLSRLFSRGSRTSTIKTGGNRFKLYTNHKKNTNHKKTRKNNHIIRKNKL